MKTVICLMHYNALHHWSKFQTNLTTFQWVKSEKPPRSSLKLYFLLARIETFEISKLDPDMHHLNTINTSKHGGVNKWSGGGRNQKKPWKYHEIKRILTFTTSKTNSDNAKEKWIFWCHPQTSNSPIRGVLLARIKFYLQICSPTVIKTAFFFLHISSFLCSIFFVIFCSTLKLILDPPLILVCNNIVSF